MSGATAADLPPNEEHHAPDRRMAPVQGERSAGEYSGLDGQGTLRGDARSALIRQARPRLPGRAAIHRCPGLAVERAHPVPAAGRIAPEALPAGKRLAATETRSGHRPPPSG